MPPKKTKKPRVKKAKPTVDDEVHEGLKEISKFMTGNAVDTGRELAKVIVVDKDHDWEQFAKTVKFLQERLEEKDIKAAADDNELEGPPKKKLKVSPEDEANAIISQIEKNLRKYHADQTVVQKDLRGQRLAIDDIGRASVEAIKDLFSELERLQETGRFIENVAAFSKGHMFYQLRHHPDFKDDFYENIEGTLKLCSRTVQR